MNIVDDPPELNYGSSSEIKAILEQMGLSPRKKWGQNFLVNKGAREKIVKSLQAKAGDTIWEIGPGLGAMTINLLKEGLNVTAFEIDPGYSEYLRTVFRKYENFNLVEGDFLKKWKEISQSNGKPDCIMGNLPYNVSSTIIAAFIEENFLPERLIFMVQKEMGDRMVSSPGNKNYSSFSILCQSACDTKVLGVLHPGSFYPRPGVSSIIIELVPHDRYKDLSDKVLFNNLVRDMFVSRRKTLLNNIKKRSRLRVIPQELLEKSFQKNGIDLSLRPETISVDQYVQVAEDLHSMIASGGQ